MSASSSTRSREARGLFPLMIALLLLLLITCRTSEISEWSVGGDRSLLRTLLSPQWNSGVKYLTVGTSNTWGVGVDPTQRGGTYPYLLSRTIKNSADFTMNVEFAAACAQSLVKDDTYDVLVVEFTPEPDNDSYLDLALRLRHHFPRALLIFLKLWDFRHIFTSGPSGDVIPFETFKLQALKDTSVQSYQFHKAVSGWSNPFQYYQNEELDQKFQKAVDAVDGKVVTLPQPVHARSALLEYAHWFSADGGFLSLQGHAVIAQRIQDLVQQMNITGLIQAYQTSGLEDWGQGDACQLWYTKDDSVNITYSANMTLSKFDSAGGRDHYALEIVNRETLTVLNPFDTARTIYLSYMASGPTSTPYPSVLVKWDEHSFVLQPQIEATADSICKHVPKTTAIGQILPGETSLTITVMRSAVTVPFRLTGVSLLAFDNLPMEYKLEHDEATPFPDLSAPLASSLQ